MQAFVRVPGGATVAVDVNADDSTDALYERVQVKSGIPASEQRLLVAGKQLAGGRALSEYNIQNHSTIDMVMRLRGGGKMRSVKMMTSHLPCGSEVTIELEDGFTKDDIKNKLVVATGVPKEHIKVLLGGVGQIMMGDRRTNISYGICGTTTGVLFPSEAET